MFSSIFGRRAVRISAAVLFLALLVAGVSIWWANHDAPPVPAPVNASAPAAQESAIEPFADIAVPITQVASALETGVNAVVSAVQPVIAAMPPSQPVSHGPSSLLMISLLASLGVLAIMAIIIWSRRSRLAWLSAVLAVASLSVMLPSSALAGAGTLTRWTLPHFLSDYAYAPALDQPNGVIYFAEHIAAGVPSAGRIGQLNLTSNDLVEWPTTYVPGYRTAVISGNVFFTEPAANLIGKLEPSTNNITRWQLPSAGGDANIFWVEGENPWYLSLNAAKLGRLNPATNNITEWALASPGTTIRFYGRDANGYMWFSLPDEAKIGRLNVTTNQITMWTLPTEKVTVMVVSSNTVWFSGAMDSNAGLYYTIHVGRLDVGTNQVTRWTIVPTDIPNEGSNDIGILPYESQFPFQGQLSTGVHKQIAFLDSSARPWFLSVRGLTRLDPTANRLLEYSFSVTRLLDIDADGVISALLRGFTGAMGFYPDTVAFFDTTTDSETRFEIPIPSHGGIPQGCGTNGFLRTSATEFWFTRTPTWPTANLSIVESLVITP